MARKNELRVLVASDGSLSATAAAVTANCFPWPDGTRTFGVVGRDAVPGVQPSSLRGALDRAARATAAITTRILAARWPGARVRVTSGPPAAAILETARRVRADVIVMGWRGHGAIRRLLSGSVSRGVVREAPCSVLVVRRAVRNVKTIVIGVDGSEQSARAVALAARLQPPAGGRIVLVTAVPMTSNPSNPLLPASVRNAAASGVASLNKSRIAEARATLESLAQAPRAAGWKVELVLPKAAPLQALLSVVAETRAQLLIVGATGTSQVQQLLLGSVAQGALDRCQVPVLIAR